MSSADRSVLWGHPIDIGDGPARSNHAMLTWPEHRGLGGSMRALLWLGLLSATGCAWISADEIDAVKVRIREMISEDPEVTLLRVEKRLRELGSSVHLLAAPLEQMRPGLEARNVDGSLASYWLWICLYPRELESTRERFGIQSPQENLLRLRETGFLMLQDSHG